VYGPQCPLGSAHPRDPGRRIPAPRVVEPPRRPPRTAERCGVHRTWWTKEPPLADRGESSEGTVRRDRSRAACTKRPPVSRRDRWGRARRHIGGRTCRSPGGRESRRTTQDREGRNAPATLERSHGRRASWRGPGSWTPRTDPCRRRAQSRAAGRSGRRSSRGAELAGQSAAPRPHPLAPGAGSVPEDGAVGHVRTHPVSRLRSVEGRHGVRCFGARRSSRASVTRTETVSWWNGRPEVVRRANSRVPPPPPSSTDPTGPTSAYAGAPGAPGEP